MNFSSRLSCCGVRWFRWPAKGSALDRLLMTCCKSFFEDGYRCGCGFGSSGGGGDIDVDVVVVVVVVV